MKYKNKISPDAKKNIPARLARISRKNEFMIPDGYFEKMNDALMQKTKETTTKNDYFTDEGGEAQGILAKNQDVLKEASFVVPDGYFDNLEKTLAAKIHSEIPVIHLPKNQKRMRWVVAVAVAASVVTFVIFHFTQITKRESFADLIHRLDIQEDDLYVFATEEDYYDYYIHEANQMVRRMEDTTRSYLHRVGLDNTKNKKAEIKNALEKVKPVNIADTLQWQDVSWEEMLNYLSETGEINDLYEFN